MSNDENNLPLHRYAELLAYETEYPEAKRAAVRAGLGVDDEASALARGRWSRAIAEGLLRGDVALVRDFMRSYAKAERRIRLRRPGVRDIRPDPELAPLAPPARLTSARDASTDKALGSVPESADAERQLPTYLQQVGHSEPPATVRGFDVDGTAFMPAPEEIRRLAEQADPRVAIPWRFLDARRPACLPPWQREDCRRFRAR